jgi:hypothetical protein
MSRDDEGNWVPWDESDVKAIPYADRPYDEIVPGLWMGGHDYSPAAWPVVVGDEFVHVFSLYRRLGHGPAVGVPHDFLRLWDGKADTGDLHRVREFADRIHDRYMASPRSSRILVRCQAGYNRSGLAVAFVLLRLGMDSVTAVDLIREKRGPHALCNAWFVSYIDDEWRRIHGER